MRCLLSEVNRSGGRISRAAAPFARCASAPWRRMVQAPRGGIMSSHILIVYGTTYGQTQKIAERIRDRLSDDFGITLVRGDAPMNPLTADHYDGVLVGGSIIAGRHQKYIEAFVRRNVATLNAMPSALFSVSGSAGSEKAS